MIPRAATRRDRGLTIWTPQLIAILMAYLI